MDRLTLLRCFVRTVDLGTLTAAAQDLGVGQSTASKWVAALEDEAGVPLLDRTTRALRPTTAGEVLLGHARALVDGWEDALAEVQARVPRVAGRLRVSVPTVFGTRHVLPHLGAFLHAWPDVELDLLLADRYVNLLEEGLDVAIRVGVAVPSTLRARRLGGTRRHLVAAPGFLAAHEPVRHPDALSTLDALVHTGVPRTIWTLSRDEEEVRVSVSGRVRADSSEALLRLARDGHGVALLATWLVEDGLQEGTLVEVLPDWSAPPAPIRALLPPARMVPGRVRALLEHLEDCWEGGMLRPRRA